MALYGLPDAPDERAIIRVVMLKDEWGCPDPRTRQLYVAGQQYDLPEDLAGCFFSTASADPAEAHAQPAEAPNSPVEGSPETAAPTLPPETDNTRPEPRRARRRPS